MPESALSSLQYLPVVVAEQHFAIPLLSVTAVRSLHDTAAIEASSQETMIQPEGFIHVMNLAELFWGEIPENKNAFIVVISIPNAIYGLLVDDVRPSRLAETPYEVPYLIESARSIFSGIIAEEGGLTPVIDPALLAEHIRRVRPQFLSEETHA